MKNRVAAVVLSVAVFLPMQVSAGTYGVCSEAIAEAKPALVAPVQPAIGVVPVTSDILVMLVENPEPGFADSVVPIEQAYYEGIFLALRDHGAKNGVWIGVMEGMDGREEPALWMRVWAETPGTCVVSKVGDRVFEERANAPMVFWRAIERWEAENPESALVYNGRN